MDPWTETTINDSRRYIGTGKPLCNLTALREVGFPPTGDSSPPNDQARPIVRNEMHNTVARPIVVNELRVPALRFGDPRVHALLAAIAVDRLHLVVVDS